MFLQARVWRDRLGGIVIESIVQEPRGRLGFERQFFPGVELGLVGWERAHSQGNILGAESPHAIRYAPSEVNQAFQRLGVEAFIRDLFLQKADDVEIKLITVTYTHPRTLRLREIQYRVDAGRLSQMTTLFEASIEVEDKRQAPRISVSVVKRLAMQFWPRYLKSPSPQ